MTVKIMHLHYYKSVQSNTLFHIDVLITQSMSCGIVNSIEYLHHMHVYIIKLQVSMAMILFVLPHNFWSSVVYELDNICNEVTINKRP